MFFNSIKEVVKLNAKQIDQIKGAIVYLKLALKSGSYMARRFMTSSKQMKRNVYLPLKKMPQTPEIKSVLKYLEDSLNSDDWIRYLAMMDEENLNGVLILLEKTVGWDRNGEDEKIIDKAVEDFKKNIEGKTIQERSEKIKAYAAKKKIKKSWKIGCLAAGMLSGGILAAKGIKRIFNKKKSAKK
ncbi:hypothetical protein EPN15_02175 [Patescibacteria group bacterium]|nr:MAG: hypothetical protein EPN15_02175 [Patescibacteria group bacterium]